MDSSRAEIRTYALTHERHMPLENNFSLVLLKLCLAFSLGVDFTFLGISERRKTVLSECQLAAFLEAVAGLDFN